jgi:hypothetical protein
MPLDPAQYSDETARLLARELLDGATPDTTIGVVSAPSVFVALKNLVRESQQGTLDAAASWQGTPKLVLLEHDDRFGVFSEFVSYDFQQPLKLPSRLKGSMDRVICDPPFLSEDCQTKGTSRLNVSLVSCPERRLISSQRPSLYDGS